MDSIRDCLLQALKAIARAVPPVSFRTGFEFLVRFVPRCAKDKEVGVAFEAANDSMIKAEKKRNTTAT